MGIFSGNKSITEFVEMMKDLYGDALVSLYVFGEGAAGHNPNCRHIKLLALMKEVSHARLKAYAAVHDKWLKKGIPAPLMLTEDTMETSTDVFPMEFLEMKETAVLLYGKDVLPAVEVSLDNLRRQCEEQVKGKLIHLRQAYMESGGDGKVVHRLIGSSVWHFTDVMRNILRVSGKTVPDARDKVVERFCTEYRLDPLPFESALRLRHDTKRPQTDALEELFRQYLDEVGRMAEVIDKLHG